MTTITSRTPWYQILGFVACKLSGIQVESENSLLVELNIDLE